MQSAQYTLRLKIAEAGDAGICTLRRQGTYFVNKNLRVVTHQQSLLLLTL